LAALSSAFAVAQFFRKMDAAQAAGRPFYEHYISERISGFMSHWMTFGGQMLIVLALLTALLMFSQAGRRYTMYGLVCAALISVGQLIGYTRSIWLATAAAVVYLVWYWRRKLLWGLPVVILVGVLMAPDSVKARLRSAVRPHGEVDSNQHRVVTWRTGWQMVKAHPWFGLGPEIVKLRFKDYVPADIPQPLPDGWYGHLHNIYLHYAAERGIPTMLALMWLLGKMLLDFVRGLRRLPPGSSDARFVLHGCVAVLIGILVTGIFELNLGDSEVLHMFLSTAAFGYVAKESAGV
jgi:O-antigen ligase